MLFASRSGPGRRYTPSYTRRASLILINGLAEQAESWYCNIDAWRPHFDVHTPHLLGGKVAVEYTVRYPNEVAKLVLLCPSGLSDQERLPVVEGVRRSDLRSLVQSVFCDPNHADTELLAYYERQLASRRWRSGLLRTIRGTMNHRLRDRLVQVKQPTLLVVGSEDRIVDPCQAVEAAGLLPHGRLVVLNGCGHAPQIEQADVINRLVIDFLQEATAS